MPESSDILNLRVSEARTKDVGRGIARIDPLDMTTLGVEVGDIVQLTGKRKTVAKVMPAYLEDRGKGIIQADGLIRQNAQIGLDEKVSIEKALYKPAQRIILSPVASLRGAIGDMRYLSSLLDGRPLVEGDRLRATLFGTRSHDFLVGAVVPRDVAVIHPKTIIEIKTRKEERKAVERARISYEDIGGLKKEIRRIREMIELPLRHPQVFERLGIDAPKGVF
ncbi:MAG: AAA family ATPase, partial [Deltaproteobacteria bacterium]|nr:AAA family ATPase [Deltaproteobacteria bacterium]